MGLPTFSKCCCLELKWGALIVAIVDALFGFGSYGVGVGFTGIGYIIWLVCLVVMIVHFIACILVAVSVFVQNKKFVICYLITGIIRVILNIVYIIMICVLFKVTGNTLISIIIVAITIALAIYFWFVVYSWYRKLGGSTPAD